MTYIMFVLTLGLFGWTVPVLYLRFAGPFFEKCRSFFSSSSEERGGRLAARLFLFLSVSLEVYILSAWTAFCVFKSFEAAKLPETLGWVCMTLGFVICEASLGYIAVKDHHHAFIMVLRSVIPMGAFAAFALDPRRIALFYGWLLPLFKRNLLGHFFGG